MYNEKGKTRPKAKSEAERRKAAQATKNLLQRWLLRIITLKAWSAILALSACQHLAIGRTNQNMASIKHLEAILREVREQEKLENDLKDQYRIIGETRK